jgi:hypothetical protein
MMVPGGLAPAACRLDVSSPKNSDNHNFNMLDKNCDPMVNIIKLTKSTIIRNAVVRDRMKVSVGGINVDFAFWCSGSFAFSWDDFCRECRHGQAGQPGRMFRRSAG